MEPFQDPKKSPNCPALTAVAGLTKEKTTVRLVILTSTVSTRFRFAKNAVCLKPTGVAPDCACQARRQDEEEEEHRTRTDQDDESDDSWEPECCECGTTTDTKGMGGVEHREDLCEWMCGRCYEYHTRRE
jgi:hypothetical protein